MWNNIQNFRGIVVVPYRELKNFLFLFFFNSYFSAELESRSYDDYSIGCSLYLNAGKAQILTYVSID